MAVIQEEVKKIDEIGSKILKSKRSEQIIREYLYE